MSGEKITSPAKFHDKTSSPLFCISMLCQSESSYLEGAMDIDMTQACKLKSMLFIFSVLRLKLTSF